MRKLSTLLTIVLSLSILAGCSSANYKLIERNGNYYIRLSNVPADSPLSSDVSGTLEIRPAVIFHSIKEMKNDILTGNFTDKELQQIANFNKNAAGNILVCDVNKLYEPMLPSDFTSLKVTWWGSSYEFLLSGSSIAPTSTFFTFISSNEYANREDPVTFMQTLDTGIVIESITPISERNATVVEYQVSASHSIRLVSYKILTPVKTLVIYEYYLYNGNEYVFNNLEIWGKQANQCFHIGMYSPTERPSIEWLSQFGIREYVETVTE